MVAECVWFDSERLSYRVMSVNEMQFYKLLNSFR